MQSNFPWRPPKHTGFIYHFSRMGGKDGHPNSSHVKGLFKIKKKSFWGNFVYGRTFQLSYPKALSFLCPAYIRQASCVLWCLKRKSLSGQFIWVALWPLFPLLLLFLFSHLCFSLGISDANSFTWLEFCHFRHPNSMCCLKYVLPLVSSLCPSVRFVFKQRAF